MVVFIEENCVLRKVNLYAKMNLILSFLILCAVANLSFAGKLYNDYTFADEGSPYDFVLPNGVKIIKDFYISKPTRIFKYELHKKDLDKDNFGTEYQQADKSDEQFKNYPGLFNNHFLAKLGNLILNKKRLLLSKLLSSVIPISHKENVVPLETPKDINKWDIDDKNNKLEDSKIFDRPGDELSNYNSPVESVIEDDNDNDYYQNWDYSSPQIEQDAALENYFKTINKFQDVPSAYAINNNFGANVINKNPVPTFGILLTKPKFEEQEKYYYPGHAKNPKKQYLDKDTSKPQGVLEHKTTDNKRDKLKKVQDKNDNKIDLLPKTTEKPAIVGIFADNKNEGDVFGRKYIDKTKNNILDEGKNLDPREVYEGDKEVVQENIKDVDTKNLTHNNEGLKDIPLNGICPKGFSKDILGICRAVART